MKRIWWRRVKVKEFCSDCGKEIHFRVWQYRIDGNRSIEDERLVKMVFCNLCGQERHKRLFPKDYGLMADKV